MNNFPSVGEKIKIIRKRFKLTQIEFAQSLEISQGTLSEIESGKAKPPFDVLRLLADKYLVDLNWLVVNRDVEIDIGLQSEELLLLDNYRNLEESAQAELLDISKIKLQRYRRSK